MSVWYIIKNTRPFFKEILEHLKEKILKIPPLNVAHLQEKKKL